MPEMSRRFALAVGGAAFATPLISSSAGSAETDVVVIGAGAAGIAAARDLAAKGLGVTLIEASGRCLPIPRGMCRCPSGLRRG